MLLPYSIVMVNLLTKTCLFLYEADMEQHAMVLDLHLLAKIRSTIVKFGVCAWKEKGKQE